MSLDELFRQLKIMNSNETEICKLKDEEKFSWKKDLIIPLCVTSVIVYIFYKLPNIVSSLNFIKPSWKDGLEEIIKQAFSPKYVLIFVLFIILLIIIIILSSIIWPFFRRCKTRLKIVKLREKQLDKSRSDYKQLEIALRSQRTVIKVDKGYFGATIDRGKENNTAPTQMLIDEYIDSIPDIANDTANPHNEDQE